MTGHASQGRVPKSPTLKGRAPEGAGRARRNVSVGGSEPRKPLDPRLRQKRDAYLDEAGLNLAAHESLVRSESAEEFEVGRGTNDLVFVEGLAKRSESGSAVLASDDQL